MENKKSKLKGFTLIELIIVLAIFSGLMVLIMSFIDPVSKQMTDTSIRERTASYVDNVSDYFDGSLRYAQFAKVYEKGICDDTLENIRYKNYSDMSIDGYDAAAGRDEKWLAVRDFADDYFDGVIKIQGTSTLVPITGKIHVLEILNDDTMLYDPATRDYTIAGKAGEIYETVYNFTAGNSIIKDTTAPVKVRDFSKANCYPSSVSVSKGPIQVINPEHFINYSYYYQLGLFNLDPVPNSDLEAADDVNQYHEATIEADGSVTVGSPLPIDSNAKYYYSRLNPLNLVSVSDPTKVKPSRFSMNVVAYEKDGTSSNMFHVSPADGSSVDVVFRSPAYMSSSSMALVNAIAASRDNEHINKYYRAKQKDETGELLDSDGNPISPGDQPGIEPLTLKKGYYDLAFVQRTSNSVDHKNSNNIYIVYAVPSEIDDADITF